MLFSQRGGCLMQRILVIEDDIDIQDILKNHLTDAGYEVVIAADDVAGIAKFDDTISLVLLDIMLPKIDGYGVCEVIRQKSQVPIIMLTALSDEENQLKITCAGLPKNCYKNVSWENFSPSAKYSGKLIPKRVKNGVILEETLFTIKE